LNTENLVFLIVLFDNNLKKTINEKNVFSYNAQHQELPVKDHTLTLKLEIQSKIKFYLEKGPYLCCKKLDIIIAYFNSEISRKPAGI